MPGDTQAPDKRIRDEVLASRSALHETKFTCCHEMTFYSNDGVFLESCTHFIGTALKLGNGAIVVARKAHHNMVLPGLRALGVNVDALLQQGAYLSLDAADALSKFMINDSADADR